MVQRTYYVDGFPLDILKIIWMQLIYCIHNYTVVDPFLTPKPPLPIPAPNIILNSTIRVQLYAIQFKHNKYIVRIFLFKYLVKTTLYKVGIIIKKEGCSTNNPYPSWKQ